MFCLDRVEAGLNSGTAGLGIGIGVEAALGKWKFDVCVRGKKNQE